MTARSATDGNTIWAQHALTENGWQSDVSVTVDAGGTIVEVLADQPAAGSRTGILLPAVGNLHSHAFQRAMAGMTEQRGPDPRDSFWTWRKLMYGFLQHLTPDDAEAIAAFGQIEMLESGFASVGEFHYLHHQPDGRRYSNRAEMCERIAAASQSSGIGLTLLPVLYEQGGCDGRALAGSQKRFGNTIDEFARLYSDARQLIKDQPQMNIGIAPHSLRAVSQSSLSAAVSLADGQPFHIHIAEQDAEVEEVLEAWNARPVEWLLDNQAVDTNWCLIHATQMQNFETEKLARSNAVAGLCPITESNLGDGIFDGASYQQYNGAWGVGSDSNVRISLSEELRTLEYSRRLKNKGRAIFADEHRSTGRVLFDSATAGGAQAMQRRSGQIGVGQLADLMALDADSVSFIAVEKDQWLDAWLFANDDRLITDVWSAGKHLVRNGRHIDREKIEQRYRKTLSSLGQKL